jgi:16S rRNA (uracil1498-N3)-methyltransferase
MRSGEGALRPPEHRFYVAAEALQQEGICLHGAQARQIHRVLRLRVGDRIRVFDGTDAEYVVVLEGIESDEVRGRIVAMCRPATESPCRLWVAVPLLKAEKLEWVVQKSVELGACGILLTVTRRTVVRPGPGAETERLKRYHRIAVEATEQCGRLQVPRIEGPLLWRSALARGSTVDLALVAHEGALQPLRAVTRRSPGFRSAIFYTGPEGGLTPEEITEAEEAGVLPISLGSRILRAETAVLAGVAILTELVEQPSR